MGRYLKDIINLPKYDCFPNERALTAPVDRTLPYYWCFSTEWREQKQIIFSLKVTLSQENLHELYNCKRKDCLLR